MSDSAAPTTTSTFEPARHLTRVGGSDYLEVKWRLVWMRDEHPDAKLLTELVSHGDNTAVFRCHIIIPSTGAEATGYGSETAGDFRDYLEKAETKAIGRACAALGFGTQFCPDHDFGAGRGRVVDAPVNRQRAERHNTPRTNQTARPPVANTRTQDDDLGKIVLPPAVNEPSASEGMIRYLHGFGREHGHDHDALKALAWPLYRVKHLDQLTGRQVKDFERRIKDGDLRDAVAPPPDGDPVERNEQIPPADRH